MAGSTTGSAERPREWRRKVLVPARVRSQAGWGDARILNASSRGMMLHTPQPITVGSVIELRRGAQLVIAKVVWREGSRAGLHSETVLPLTDILCMSEAPTDRRADEAPVTAPTQERTPDADFYRAWAKLFESASVAIIAGTLAVACSSILGGFAAGQLAIVEKVLAG